MSSPLTDVIVVGAGPVGLMLAGELRLGGADVVIYDRLPAPTGESRALGFNRRAAELLDQRGLLTGLGEFRWGPMGHFGGVRFDLDLTADDHAGVLGLSQARTEDMLGRWVADLGVPVRRRPRRPGLRTRADSVTAVLTGPDGPVEHPAAWLVGCDGPDGAVRELAGIEVCRWESTRGMYTAEISGVSPRPRPIGERLPGGNMVVCTPVGPGRHRIVIHDTTLPARPDSATLTFPEVARAWLRLTGEDISAAEVSWVWARGNAAALAASYRSGRVLVAGDAAHDIPPLAAWGLSAGLQDAVNLGWKLAATATGHAPDGLLDSYDDERRPAGQLLIRNARAASLVYLGDADVDPVRRVLAEMFTDAGAAEHIAGVVSGLGVRYDVGPGTHRLLGRRLPPALEVPSADGVRTRVADLLAPARGLLITTDPGRRDADDWAHLVTTVVAHPETSERLAANTVLVRPDGYVAWTDTGTDTELADALTRWFGAPHPAATAGRRPHPAGR